MPRLALLRVVAVSAVLSTIASCGKPAVKTAAIAPGDAPIMVDIKCPNGGVSIGLKDNGGRSGWVLGVKPGEDIEWRVPNNITSIKVSPRGQWPLGNEQPGQNGAPAKAKVNANATPGQEYEYIIEAVCQPPVGSPINVTIDPDMIILPGR
jgi:hypothetical protein